MRLLVAVDLRASEHDWILERAVPLVARLGGTVDVLYVGEGSPEYSLRLIELLAAFPPDQRGSTRMIEGEALQILEECSREYDLLFIGPREAGPVQRALRGSMIVKMLKATHCPVMVPRKDAQTEPKRMIVGVDLNGTMKREILSLAATWANRFGIKLDAVYAVGERLPNIHGAIREKALKQWEAAREPERSSLEKLMREVVPSTVCGDALLGQGEPEVALEELSASYDVMVVGNRNREGILARYLIGPVSGNIARQANCDVLTLPTADITV
jgi:nucleotide-binding universal stress UspA family protein